MPRYYHKIEDKTRDKLGRILQMTVESLDVEDLVELLSSCNEVKVKEHSNLGISTYTLSNPHVIFDKNIDDDLIIVADSNDYLLNNIHILSVFLRENLESISKTGDISPLLLMSFRSGSIAILEMH